MEKRMYFFVPYNISPIQQAIQAGHAALEYAHQYGDSEPYIDFIENWKTWIILNGGTTSDKYDEVNGFFEPRGSLNKIEEMLREKSIKYSTFREPDLNDALTAVCFICDEKVFNWEDYPDYITWIVDSGHSTKIMRDDELNWIDKAWENHDLIDKYIKSINITVEDFFLKKLINGKKLA